MNPVFAAASCAPRQHTMIGEGNNDGPHKRHQSADPNHFRSFRSGWLEVPALLDLKQAPDPSASYRRQHRPEGQGEVSGDHEGRQRQAKHNLHRTLAGSDG